MIKHRYFNSSIRNVSKHASRWTHNDAVLDGPAVIQLEQGEHRQFKVVWNVNIEMFDDNQVSQKMFSVFQ